MKKSRNDQTFRDLHDCFILSLNSLNHDLELRSSSFTFGNENKLSFHSLNHDLFTITNVEALSWVIHTLALEVVIHFV